jgi:hypothetical protein
MKRSDSVWSAGHALRPRKSRFCVLWLGRELACYTPRLGTFRVDMFRVGHVPRAVHAKRAVNLDVPTEGHSYC